MQLTGVGGLQMVLDEERPGIIIVKAGKKELGTIREVGSAQLNAFDIKQAVYFADIHVQQLIQLVEQRKISYKEVNKFPAMQRDLALVVDRQISFDQIDKQVKKSQLSKLKQVRLFDVFESDKLGRIKNPWPLTLLLWTIRKP